MNRDIKGCLSIIFWAVAGMVVLGIAMIVVVSRGGGEKPITDLLPTLPATELQALEALCQASGFRAADLRPLGITTDALLRDARNARSVVIRDGHVRVICIRDSSLAKLPSIAALKDLEALWMEGGKLAEWPSLVSLSKLTELQLNGNPLPTPPANTLPASLIKLGLSGSKVESVDALTGLALDELNLSRTPITQLPATVPAKGAWRLILDETAITQPPGYRTELPKNIIKSGPGLQGGKIEGMAAHKDVKVTITGNELKAVTTLVLPTNTTLYHASGPVEIEGHIASGKMRVWLQEPAEGLFGGPWFKAGKIQGFGLTHRMGYLTTEVSAGTAARGRGTLILQGAPPHFNFAIIVEPLGDAPGTGIELNMRTPL